MAVLDDRRREFVARTVADVGKTIIAVAFASYFFERYPLLLRWILPMLAFGSLIVSVVIYPKERGGQR